MEEKGKNPSLGFSVRPGGEGRAVKAHRLVGPGVRNQEQRQLLGEAG